MKPCDGTWQDYMRHYRRKEVACAESKRSWRTYIKAVRAAKRAAPK